MFSHHDYSYCITERISSGASVKYDQLEITFVISVEDNQSPDQIERVLIDDNYEVILDWDKSLVLHPTGHSDPIFLFDLNGKKSIQIIHYRINDIDSVDDINIDLYVNGKSYRVKSQFLNEYDYRNSLIDVSYDSSIAQESVRVCSPQSFEVVFQGSRYGRFFEERMSYPEAGEYVIPVPMWSSDYYGVCISSHHKVGGFEHKLMLMGNLGSPGGKYLLTRDNRVLEPRVIDEFYMKSLLVHLDSSESVDIFLQKIDFYLLTFREIELAIDLDNCSTAILNIIAQRLKSITRVSLTRFSRSSQSSPYIIEYIHLGNELTAQSNFFLSDFSKFPLSQRMELSALDQSWINNVSVYAPKNGSYGMGYSYFLNNEWPIQSDFLFERVRPLKASYPCVGCNEYQRCATLAPYPIQREFLIGRMFQQSGCGLNDFLLNNK